MLVRPKKKADFYPAQPGISLNARPPPGVCALQFMIDIKQKIKKISIFLVFCFVAITGASAPALASGSDPTILTCGAASGGITNCVWEISDTDYALLDPGGPFSYVISDDAGVQSDPDAAQDGNANINIATWCASNDTFSFDLRDGFTGSTFATGSPITSTADCEAVVGGGSTTTVDTTFDAIALIFYFGTFGVFALVAFYPFGKRR